MAKQSNQYPGINPHLNSLLQTPGTEDQPSLFPTFHTTHINHIADLLNEQLPPNYTAYPEQSLQVRGIEWGGQIVLNRPEPDISVFQRMTSASPVYQVAVQPTWEAAIATVLESLKHPSAVIIRETVEQNKLGRIVTRIELLSPSNKVSAAYQEKRIEAMQNGTPLLEIDYLHEFPSPIPGLPVYPKDENATPFYIAVSDPRPTWEEGRIRVYGFHVGMPVPKVPVPLADHEQILFDFEAAYQRTFTSRRFANLIDESLKPERIHTYSQKDQAIIRQQMAEIGRSST